MSVRSRGSPSSSATMPSIAWETSGGGADSRLWGNRRATRARVWWSVCSGSHTEVTPRSDQAIAHEPIAVGNRQKLLVVEVLGSAIAGWRHVRVDVAVGRRRHGVRIDAVERLERRARFAARQQARTGAQEHLLGRDAAIEQDADEAVAHLIPVLRPPHHLLRRIRIEAIGRGVVEMADKLQLRSLRQRDGLGELIAHLPLEVPRALHDGGRLAVGTDDAQLEILAAEMHVRL